MTNYTDLNRNEDGKVKMYPSGKLVDPFNLSPDDIEIEDIAHHLSRICRWNGGTPGFYSVAEHSIRVAAELPKHYVKWGLLHDAAEAYIGDIVRPIKINTYFRRMIKNTLDEELRHALVHEKVVLEIIAEKFELQWPIPDEIWKADDIRLEEERRLIAAHKLYGNNPAIAHRFYERAWQKALKWN